MRPTGIEYSNPFVVEKAYYIGAVPMPVSVGLNGLASVVSTYLEENARIIVKFVDKNNEVIDKMIKTDLQSGTNLGIYNSSKQAFAAVFGYTNPVGFGDGFTTIETYDKRIVRELKRQDLIIPKTLFSSKEREIQYKPNTKAIKDLEDLQKEIATLEKEIKDEPDNAEFLKKPLGVLLKRLMRLEAVVEANEARKTEIENDNKLIRERNKELLKEQNAFKKKMKEEAKQKEKERLANIRKQDEEYLLERRRQRQAIEERKKRIEGTGIVDNPELYEKAKAYADNIFKKPSAFKSGFIVKKYKELGGTYSGEKPNKTGIARWFKEEWKDIGNKEYPVYRPTKRITKKTPLTIDEIEPSNLEEQIALKQEIKGDANLPPFHPLEKGDPKERMKRVEVSGGKIVALGVQAEKIPKQDEIWKWSNPVKVAEKAKKYLGDMAVVFRSTKPKKKYMIFDPENNKWVFFGEMGYKDGTLDDDDKNNRRERFLKRNAKWSKAKKYSPAFLAYYLLWT
jgi:hypothetical protein